MFNKNLAVFKGSDLRVFRSANGDMEYTHHSDSDIVDFMVIPKQDGQTRKYVLEADGKLTSIEKSDTKVEKMRVRALTYSGKRLYGLSIQGSSLQV